MKTNECHFNQPQANYYSTQESSFGNLNHKKIKKNYGDYLEYLTIATGAVFGMVLASKVCYDVFDFSSSLQTTFLAIYSVNFTILGGIIGGFATSLLFNPIHF